MIQYKIEGFFRSTKIWEYEIIVKDNIIVDCSNSPQGRPHWCIGKTLTELKEFYNQVDNYTWKTIYTEL